MGAAMVVDIGGVRQGVSELIRAVYTKLLGIYCGFASILNLNFRFPNFGGRDTPMAVGYMNYVHNGHKPKRPQPKRPQVRPKRPH